MFPGGYEPNPLTQLLAQRRAAGSPLIDLTESNPAVHGLSPDPMCLAPALSPAAALPSRTTRCAGRARGGCLLLPGAGHRHRGATSGAHRRHQRSLRLAAEAALRAGDCVLIPAPGYPLCADLARLERVRSAPYRLRPAAGSWCLDRAGVSAGLRRGARAAIVISPHNPTGAYLAAEDRRWLGRACAGHGAALIVDEVFADYPWDAAARHGSWGDPPALTFLLGGLSKALALPQLKCSWIVVAGPRRPAEAAIAHLEFLGDTYLSVMPWSRRRCRCCWRGATRYRIRSGPGRRQPGRRPRRRLARRPSRRHRWRRLVVAAAGPPGVDDAEFAMALLRDHGTLVHPGYLFDAEDPGVALR